MMIRTIAASAAVAFALAAAVPGVAMASTAGPASRPAPVRCPPKVVHDGGGPVTRAACCAVKVVKKSGGTVTVTRSGCCASMVVVGPASVTPSRQVPVPGCAPRPMTFDLPAFATTATEVSGPRLTVHELVLYKHRIFLVRSVHGRSFTVALLSAPVRVQVPRHKNPVTIRIQLKPFRNGATAITDGHAVVLRGPVAIVLRGQPRSLLRHLSQTSTYPIGGGTRTVASRNVLTAAARPGAVSMSVCTWPGKIASRAAGRVEPSQLPSLTPPPSSP